MYTQNTRLDAFYIIIVGGAVCELCNKERVMERKLRDPLEIVAHYGIWHRRIPNQVMRDAAKRELLQDGGSRPDEQFPMPCH